MVFGASAHLSPPPPCLSSSQNRRHQRVPIIVTGNDLSTVFAPLLRDGRMEKFYYAPTFEDLTKIVGHMYRDDDGISAADVETLLKTFPNQSLDFYGAIKNATYDDAVRTWIREVCGGAPADESANMSALAAALVRKEGAPPPATPIPRLDDVRVTLADLLAAGARLVEEQDAVNAIRLSTEYLKDTGSAGGLLGLQGDYVEPDE